MKKKLLKCMIYLLSWIIIAKIIEVIFGNSPARVAYGLLSAWWAALYICRLIDLKLDLIVLLLFSGIPFLIYLKLTSHDDNIFDLFWICVSTILYVSPFFLHMVIAFFEKQILKKALGNRKSEG
jgi:hypothetical protein